MQRTHISHMNCSIARSLDVVGEWWTLLIVRDVFRGNCRFEQLRRSLGVSKKVLTDRLQTLCDHDVLTRVPGEHGYDEYKLTRKGRDLQDVLLAVMKWGDKWQSPDGPPLRVRHDCGHVATPVMVCGHCHEELTPFNVTMIPGKGARVSDT